MEECIDPNVLFCITKGHLWGLIFLWLIFEIWMRIFKE